MAIGQRYDSERRIWIDREQHWRRVTMPATSDSALLKRKPLKSEQLPPPPKDET
jgi:hypothetical protein